MTTHPFEQLYYIYDAGYRFGPPDSVWTPGKWPAPRVRPAEVPVVERAHVVAAFYREDIADAALVILAKARAAGTYDIVVSLADFEEPTWFLHLLNYGSGFFGGASMLVGTDNRREFKPTDTFWDRVVGQKQETAK